MGLVVAGAGLGLLLAAQIGPVTLLIVRWVLRGGRALAVGLAMAAAVTVVDLLYATVGLAGAGHLLDSDGVRLALGLVSAAVLVALGARALAAGLRTRVRAAIADDPVGPRPAFATALAATALNPLTIALWTVSFPAAAPRAASDSVGGGALMLAGVAVGTAAWYGGFSTAVALARRRVGEALVRGVDVVVGSGLVAFGSVLGYRALFDRR